MSAMQWQERDTIDGSLPGGFCEVTLSEGVPASRLDVYSDGDQWTWAVSLYVSEHKHRAYGYGCATEGKARFMAMSLVSALLQIIDGVKPHEVD